jgi:hypothetical protein
MIRNAFARLLRGAGGDRGSCRCSARMTPILASIVGPPDVATRISVWAAACHSGALCSALGSFVMYVPGVFEGDQLATAGQRDRFVEMT